MDHPLIQIKKLHPDAEIPQYMTEMAAGMDICALIEKDLILRHGERALIPTGLAFAIPKGYEIQVRPRSGLAIKHGISLVNSPGTIDADYRGEVSVIMINYGKDDFIIRSGERIAQLVVAPVSQATLEVVADLNETPRGKGGFGHTGQ